MKFYHWKKNQKNPKQNHKHPLPSPQKTHKPQTNQQQKMNTKTRTPTEPGEKKTKQRKNPTEVACRTTSVQVFEYGKQIFTNY